MKFSISTLAIVAILLLTTSRPTESTPAPEDTDNCQRAYDECDFRFGFTKKLQTYPLHHPSLPNSTDTPITPRIRSKRLGQRLGILNANEKTPEFIFKRKAFPVSNFGTPPYSYHHFKPFATGSDGSAIGHETFTGDQYEYARFRCVRLYFSSFEVLDEVGNVKRVENNVPFSKKKCVVFRTK